MLFLNRDQLAKRRAALIAVWNSAAGRHLPLAEPLWLQNIENDPLFKDGDVIVRETYSGFSGIAITRMLSSEEIDANPGMEGYRNRGHIMALAVHPQYQFRGVGSELLTAAEDSLRKRGAKSIALWGPPGHLVPGPSAEYGDRGFWRRRGYVMGGLSYDLKRNLEDWQSPASPERVTSGEFAYRQGRPDEQEAILAFLEYAFPGRWRYDITRFFATGYRPEDMTLLVDAEDKVRGFLCSYHKDSGFIGAPVHWYPGMKPDAWGGMGPLGIDPTIRGGGLGLGLVAAGTDYLYSLGVRDCAIDWTDLVDFYGKLGYRPWLTWLSFSKEL